MVFQIFFVAVAPCRAHGAPDLRGLTNAQYAACVADAKRRQLAGVSSSDNWGAIWASPNVFTLVVVRGDGGLER